MKEKKTWKECVREFNEIMDCQFCCERFEDSWWDHSINQEAHGDGEFRYFVRLAPFVNQPFNFKSTRILFCPFCGQKLGE